MGLTNDITLIKQNYRELFQLAHQRLLDLFMTLRVEYQCPQCTSPPEAVDEVLHAECGYREWQKAVIITLEQTIGKQILESLEKIKAQKEVLGGCHNCGVCCSLASSEFSMAELEEKAKNGDWFAGQFTSVFLPYESPEAAEAKFPEVVSEIRTQAVGPVYFYHCPYLTEDNLCSIYHDPRRPEICASYPDTPLVLTHKKCGYTPWRTEMLPTTLLAHASLELCQYYANRILDAVKSE
jgi:Fe-S-cluster containining protein